MSTKKLIKDLLEKLKLTEDPTEREDIEDQILRLAEQDEMIDNMTKLEPIPPNKLQSDNSNILNPNLNLELDEKEKIRLERYLQREAKEETYKLNSKLESKEEELLRNYLLNQELASNEEYAFRKQRKATGAKNKNKSKNK
jgi:hypothetical protein